MDRKFVRLAPINPTAHYNLACSLALKKRKADAVRALPRSAVELGYRDLDLDAGGPRFGVAAELPGIPGNRGETGAIASGQPECAGTVVRGGREI